MRAFPFLFTRFDVTGLCVIAALAAGCTFDSSQLRGLPDGAVGPPVVADTGAAGGGGDTTNPPDAPSAMDGATIPTDTTPSDSAPPVADTGTPDTFISSHTSTDTSTQTTPDAGSVMSDVLPATPDTLVAVDSAPTGECSLDQSEVVYWQTQCGMGGSYEPYFGCNFLGSIVPLWLKDVPGCESGQGGTRIPCDQLTTKERCLMSRNSTTVQHGVCWQGANCAWNGSKT